MSRRILVVEDEETNVIFLQRAMQRVEARAELHVAWTGREALDYLQGAGQFSNRQHFPLPALVLLDLRLPGLPGLEVLRWIRAQSIFNCLIVLVFSTSEDVRDIRSAYELGANAYIVKPCLPRELDKVVRGIQDFWFTHNRTLPL